jgi:hypothetical protein
MELVFTKGPGKFDLMEIFRTGAPPERVDCPKQRIIPHDMIHYAVERLVEVLQGAAWSGADGSASDIIDWCGSGRHRRAYASLGRHPGRWLDGTGALTGSGQPTGAAPT